MWPQTWFAGERDMGSNVSSVLAAMGHWADITWGNHMWWYTKMQHEILQPGSPCVSLLLWLRRLIFDFFCWGEIRNRSVSGEALRSEKLQPGMRSWWWTNGWKECRSVIFWGLADTNLLGLCLVGKKATARWAASCWSSIRSDQWWGFDESILSTIYKETLWISLWQKDRGLPTFLACLPWWGSRSTRCSQFSHEGYVHYDSWPGWQADTLQLLTFCWVFNCRWWMHHEHDGKVGCDGNL